MILTPIRRCGTMILMLLTLVFSNEMLVETHTTATNQKSHLARASDKQVSSKQGCSHNNTKSSSLPDLRKYLFGTSRKKALLRTVMPYVTNQNAVITTEHNWLTSKQYQSQWSPAERARLKDIAKRYKMKRSGNTRKIPWNTLLEHVDIIPTSMVATMAAVESGWGTSRLARNNNNLFGIKCMKGRCTNTPGKVKGYSRLSSVKGSVSAYVTNLNTHPAYPSFRKSRVQLRKADQEVTVTAMIHKLKSYSTKGESYNDYLFAVYQDNRRLIAVHM